MYKSPVMVLETFMDSVLEERDDKLVAILRSKIDVDVDKDELIRALQYDRDQYNAGYKDGRNDAALKWISVSERFPEAGKEVLCLTKGFGQWVATWDDYGDEMWSDGEIWMNKYGITHWMPLPEPPEVTE